MRRNSNHDRDPDSELKFRKEMKAEKDLEESKVSSPEDPKKEFFRCVWTLADKLDIDDWDELVAPLVTMICEPRGWDYSKMLDDHEREKE